MMFEAQRTSYSTFTLRSLLRQGRGFSLIEIAVVLVILSILLAVIAVPLATQVNQRKSAETRASLEIAQRALLGFAAANGRLPCPATDGTGGTNNSLGDEAFATPANNATDGVCARFVGLLPSVALGLSPVDSQGFLVDGWGIQQNRIRYAVWGKSAPPNLDYRFTKTNGMQGQMSLLAAETLISVCQSAPTSLSICGSGIVKLTDKSPAVIYSLGANAATGGTGPDELHNVDQNLVFVSHDPTPAGSTAGEFDDIVTWISLNALFDRMLQAQRLP
jgi:prepilin-type N-terminal cleavage/methylation domain-containing protein